jgi:hypothetical protein
MATLITIFLFGTKQRIRNGMEETPTFYVEIVMKTAEDYRAL